MRFYKQQHKFYCGVDLNTKQMYCCIVDPDLKYVLNEGRQNNPLRIHTSTR